MTCRFLICSILSIATSGGGTLVNRLPQVRTSNVRMKCVELEYTALQFMNLNRSGRENGKGFLLYMSPVRTSHLLSRSDGSKGTRHFSPSSLTFSMVDFIPLVLCSPTVNSRPSE